MAFEKYKKSRKESQAFKNIVAKRTLQARRKAYEEEALKVARERGRALARKKPLSERLGNALVQKVQGKQAPAKRVTTVKRKKKPAKRVTTKKVYKKKAPIRKVQAPSDKPQVFQKPAGFEGIY